MKNGPLKNDLSSVDFRFEGLLTAIAQVNLDFGLGGASLYELADIRPSFGGPGSGAEAKDDGLEDGAFAGTVATCDDVDRRLGVDLQRGVVHKVDELDLGDDSFHERIGQVGIFG